ncbi:posphoenolpyruvate synthetase regulatory kinase/phosphorylase PpsR [Paralysiella testudinis]|uniref:Putative phosphoenolpyruvate synthase regulatory protein n=1 Tax=Paralysiella testudinis TaxID=2809020 RepID=A0A892ZH38_9NEIS|nr:pyruvate, water dikinase regulatory protein [Paralysiella testudinis]QRQ81147.1 kinase/pyrophosphorylase [Paralysiella testudinis]
MNQPSRHAFFISDRTGITAESMGEALLNQFDGIEFKRATYPFVDTEAKARETVALVNQVAANAAERPLIFSSIVDEDIRKIVKTSAGLHLSFFDAFMGELETELSLRANHQIGRTHGIQDTERYDARMEAVNFSISHDDGVSDKDLQKADVILVGVSRSGKTPTCLYLALQYGIRAANYPLTPDDLDSTNLPRMLKPFKHKIYGLTIEPQRLHHIRSERRPDSRYASIENCRFEVNEAESMFRQHNIPFTNTTHKSIEELAASILIATKLQRRF